MDNKEDIEYIEYLYLDIEYINIEGLLCGLYLYLLLVSLKSRVLLITRRQNFHAFCTLTKCALGKELSLTEVSIRCVTGELLVW